MASTAPRAAAIAGLRIEETGLGDEAFCAIGVEAHNEGGPLSKNG